MFCIHRYFTLAITFTILISSAFADIIIFKSGERIEGRVIKETDQQLTLEVKVSAGITDERVVAREEVDRIEKISPETEAYKSVVTIQPGNNSLAEEQYEPIVRTLQAYLKQYPNGAHTADVQATLNEFLTEKKRVEDGEMKLRGQWLSRAEVEKEKLQIDGLLALEHMKNLSNIGDNIGALNAFATVEKTYAGVASMPEMIELAKKLIAAIKPVVERAIPDQKALKAQKEKGFADVGAADRVEMIAAYKAEMAQIETLVAQAEAAGQWPPFIVASEKSLTALLARAAKESTRLAALPVEKMKKSLQLTNRGKKQIADGNLEAAASTLKEATTLWPVNELAVRLSKEVTKLKAAAPKNPSATPAPAPATPKPKGSNTQKPSTAPKADAATGTTEEESAPFYKTLPGAISIVVGVAVVLVGVNIFKKIKAGKSDPAE